MTASRLNSQKLVREHDGLFHSIIWFQNCLSCRLHGADLKATPLIGHSYMIRVATLVIRC